MKVDIGKYKRYYSAHDITDPLWKIKYIPGKMLLNIEKCLHPVFDVINKFVPDRKVDVRIDSHDVWSMDHTLALIIVPMLKQLRQDKHGAPNVDDEDCPEEFRTTNDPDYKEKKEIGDVDQYFFERWDWVLNEMIWSFSQLMTDVDWEDQFFGRVGQLTSVVDWEDQFFSRVNDNGEVVHEEHCPDKQFPVTFQYDEESYNKHRDRMENGFRLFGKYYMALWS